MTKTLRIEPGAGAHEYRFSIDGVNVSSLITQGIMTFYYGGLDDDQKQCRLQMAATFPLPERYQMTVHKEKTNGSVHTRNTDSRQSEY